jgi:hypothetical protein
MGYDKKLLAHGIMLLSYHTTMKNKNLNKLMQISKINFHLTENGIA